MFSPDKWFGSGEFYNGVATQSLRMVDSDTSHLTMTHPGAGNTKTWTWSGWVKRTKTGTNDILFSQFTTNSDVVWTYFSSGDQLNFQSYEGSNQIDIKTTAKFRDTSSWYHIVVVQDTTESTNTNRAKMYVNGKLQTDLVSTTYPNEDADLKMNNGDAPIRIGSTPDSYGTGAGYKLSGYIAEVNFLDGIAISSTQNAAGDYILDDLGELKNGVWIPKLYTGSYGTNGFRLEFKNTSVGSGTASTIGADTKPSGTLYHFDSTNINTRDCNWVDSPENNWCILNTDHRVRGASNVPTFDEAGLKITGGGNAIHIRPTMAINEICKNGGVYWEARLNGLTSTATPRTYFGLVGDNGINNHNNGTDLASYSFPIKMTIQHNGYIQGGTQVDGSTETNIGGGALSGDYSSLFSMSVGDVVGFAVKSDGKVFISKNGTFINSLAGAADPANGTNPVHVIDLDEGDWFPYAGYAESNITFNFGQEPTFNGDETPGGTYTDSNGRGKFLYQPPTGYLAMCAANMVEPKLGPNSPERPSDYFNIVRYSGNGSTQSITGVGFAPDFVWIKKESGGTARNAIITDTARGVTKCLSPALTDGEFTNSGGVTAFGSDGFSVGSYDSVNESGNSDIYNAWNWRVTGGVATATASEAGSNPGYTQYAQPNAGFSIIKYVGTQSAGTIPHGLGAVPRWIILKNLDIDGNSWIVYHDQQNTSPANEFLRLEDTHAAAASSTRFNNTTPTDTVFTVGADSNINDDGQNCIAYVWAEVEGYSKFGGYFGNGSASDGPTIYTGFSPAWVMIKRVDSTDNWQIFNNKIDVDNPHFKSFFSDTADHMSTYGSARLDFYSYGFKLLLNASTFNTSAAEYVYMAFAEQPFKYANAR